VLASVAECQALGAHGEVAAVAAAADEVPAATKAVRTSTDENKNLHLI
jgi:hypothetical protein